MEFVGGSPNECCSERGVEGVRDFMGECPGEDGDTGDLGPGERSFGGLLVVGMAGDAIFVEHEECADTGGGIVDGVDKLLKWDVGEAPVGVVEKTSVSDPEDRGGGVELFGANVDEVAIEGAEGGCFTVGEAQHAGYAAGIGQGGEDRPETKGFVVWVGAHGQEAGRGWWCGVHEVSDGWAVPMRLHGIGTAPSLVDSFGVLFRPHGRPC